MRFLWGDLAEQLVEGRFTTARHQITRRHFLNAATLAAVGIVVTDPPELDASAVVVPSGWSSTDHFWYRLQPAGPYIDSQRENKAFGFSDTAVLFSEDNAHTWPHSMPFPNARNITFSSILKNGNILFATDAKLYVSADNLHTYRQITVKDANGADYVPHTPQNREYPGWYFHPLDGVHCMAYNPVENAFYVCTGDRDIGDKHECHWLKGTYEADRDEWRWIVLVSDSSNSRYKSGGVNFAEGKLHWIADANGPQPHDRGVFRCDPADIARPEAHTMLFNPLYESANMINEDGVILASHYAPASPYATGFIISPDMGRTWAQYDLKEFGRRSPVRFHRKNSEGWFRIDLRSGWIERGEVLFVKPKQAFGVVGGQLASSRSEWPVGRFATKEPRRFLPLQNGKGLRERPRCREMRDLKPLHIWATAFS